MSARAASWLAWCSCILSLALTALSLLLFVQNWSREGVDVFDYWFENTMLAIATSPVGAVVASRRPDHPVGWLFCAIGFIAAARHFGAEYATYAVPAGQGALPWGAIAAWLSSWVWFPGTGLIIFLGLLFPDGHLPSRRWRPFAWFAAAVVVGTTIAVAFSPGPLSGFGSIENPFPVEGAPRLATPAEALMWSLVLVTAISLLVRLNHATGVMRQQIKWFAYVTAVAVIGGVLRYVGYSGVANVGWVRTAGIAFMLVGFVGIPVAMGNAILKYRLYDIDLIINRTLVYGSLTAVLVAVYFGGVVGLQYVFRALTGGESQLAVVASTLAIAALFNPLRRRIQSFIDRRFYRRKYDARKTLEGFSTKLRDETDLEALSDDLVGVVRETMQPARVSLWLRPAGAVRRATGGHRGPRD